MSIKKSSSSTDIPLCIKTLPYNKSINRIIEKAKYIDNPSIHNELLHEINEQLQTQSYTKAFATLLGIRAYIYMRAKKFELAHTDYDTAISCSPLSFELYRGKADTYQAQLKSVRNARKKTTLQEHSLNLYDKSFNLLHLILNNNNTITHSTHTTRENQYITIYNYLNKKMSQLKLLKI